MSASKTTKLTLLGVLVTITLACSASPGVPMDAAVLDALSVDGALEGPSADASMDRPRADGLVDGLPLDAGADAKPKEDAFVPLSLTVTVNQIPAAMNGSVPFTDLAGASKPFRLTVPRHGFTVDILFAGSEAKTSTLKVSANKDLGSGSSLVAAGTDLVVMGFTMTKGRASLRVPAALALPLGTVTFTASMSDGTQTLSGALTVDVAEKTFALDPFRLKDRWLVVTDQDNYTIGLKTDPAGTLTVASSPLPNGVADLDEDLRLVGLGCTAMLPAASQTQGRGVIGTNAIIKAWITEEIFKALRSAYLLATDGSQGPASVNIAFLHQGDPGAPPLSSFALQTLMGGETHKNFSAISIGGGDPSRPFLGLSKTIDLRNIRNEANIGPTYGVFTTRAVSAVFALLNTDPQMKVLAQTFFGEFVAVLGTGGKAIGESPLDATILADGFDP
ncbi:MAG: hypothetical protein KAI47_23960 [Deltaproteobacteria bacterium]|nr:hypothetical protein [Deltaproteobacteria bacterium]